jgi:hypothetical protein
MSSISANQQQSFKELAQKVMPLIASSVNATEYGQLAATLNLIVHHTEKKDETLAPRVLVSSAPEGVVIYDSSKGENNKFENIGNINKEHSAMTRMYIAQGQFDFFSGNAPKVVKSVSKSKSAAGNRNYETFVVVDELDAPVYYMVLSYTA